MKGIQRISVILLVLTSTTLYGQIGKHLAFRSESSIRKHADIYFERNAFSHAAKLYQKIVTEYPHDLHLQLRLGDCYRLLREPHNAVYWYSRVVPNDQSSNIHMFHYASVLCATKKYQKAKHWYIEYLKVHPEDQRAQAALESLNQPNALFNGSYTVERFPIEFPGAVFSPAYFDDGLVFVAEGNTGALAQKLTTWIEGPYFDLYFVSVNQGKPGSTKYFDQKLNSVFHEGPATFFADGEKVIFTRSSFRKGHEDTRNLKLMIAEQNRSGNWSSPRKLFQHENYSNGHPAVNQQGSVMYFASNKPGGYGGTDLYRSDCINGVWQEPVNAGPEINTAGNELFPSLDSSGMLYFASDGHGGLGGLDIFRADPSGYKQPSNMGYPINSQGDDFGIIWAQDKKSGYFSTNREGKDRIYHLELNASHAIN